MGQRGSVTSLKGTEQKSGKAKIWIQDMAATKHELFILALLCCL